MSTKSSYALVNFFVRICVICQKNQPVFPRNYKYIVTILEQFVPEVLDWLDLHYRLRSG